MDYGERVYRQLYDRGGLADRLSGLHGLGDMQFALTPNRISRALQTGLVVQQSSPTSMPVDAGAQPPPESSVNCDCVVANTELDDPAARAQLLQMCASNPIDFGTAMAQQGISLECQSAWYAKPSTWAMAGGAVVAVGILAWMFK